MILTDSMLDAAYRFRTAEPWAELADSDIFAVKTSDNTTAYCSIMGNAGQHHSLGIYIGDEGFSTFLNTLAANNMGTVGSIAASVEFDCINCDFMQAKDIDSEVKKIIRSYAERKSMKIPRKSGWIDFTRFTPFKGQQGITDSHDALIAEEVLTAAAFFADEFKEKSYSGVGLDPVARYPTPKGGKRIPLITSDGDGRYHISTTTTPPLIARQYIAPPFDNDILSHRLKAMEKTDGVECRLQHLPMPIGNEDGTASPMTGMLLMADEYSGEMLPPLVTADYPDAPQDLLMKLANHISKIDICPRRITVSDDKTYMLIKDFCQRCGIQLRKVKELPDMDYICEMMIHGMMLDDFLTRGM